MTKQNINKIKAEIKQVEEKLDAERFKLSFYFNELRQEIGSSKNQESNWFSSILTAYLCRSKPS